MKALFFKKIFLISTMILMLFIFSAQLRAQTISGTVTDKTTGQPVPFASIGFTGRHTGVLSDEQGKFILPLPSVTENDSLRITAIGYNTTSFGKKEYESWKNSNIPLKALVYDLAEVKVKAKKVKIRVLGTEPYSERNCSAFAGESDNWIGKQVAIRAGNKEGISVYIEEFRFFIIKNEYADSLRFRLMLYSVNASGFPGPTFLAKPVIFKTAVKKGEVKVDLRPYNINTTGDFFISLECLEQKMESTKFCFAGSYAVPSFYKTAPFAEWGRVRGGGADLNVLVSFVK